MCDILSDLENSELEYAQFLCKKADFLTKPEKVRRYYPTGEN